MDIKDTKYKSKIISYFINKNKLIDFLLKTVISEKKKMRILSLGCGTGEEIKVLSKYGDVYAVDINEEVLRFVDRKLCKDIKICDVCNISFEENFFDIVCGFDVLEHVEDDKKATEEIYRVLRPNGRFIFTVPAFNFIFSSHDVALGHKRRYNLQMIKKLFSKFKFEQLFFYQYILFPFMVIFRILRKRSKNMDWAVVPSFGFDLINFFSKIELILLKFNIKFNLFGLTLCGIVKK